MKEPVNTEEYILIPYRADAGEKLLVFEGTEGPLFFLNIRFAKADPEAVFHFPIPEGTVSFTLDGDSFFPELSSEAGCSVLSEALPRPALSFSPAVGWTNDPNGLFFLNGKWHMYFQHNPVGAVWGNMCWGHAVSEDLVHWEELPIVMYPDRFGAMFSGSAIVDYENMSGLGTPGVPAILIFYTAAGACYAGSDSAQSCQCMAYSTDCGHNFTKYAGNPVIPTLFKTNRDPKVVRDGHGGYLMALYLDDPDGHFGIFASSDLIHWKHTQTLSVPRDAECPDLYPLPFEGGTKWVFSGARDFYLIGDMNDGVFVPDPEYRDSRGTPLPGRLHRRPAGGYAGQTFSDVRDERRVKIYWNRFLGVPEKGPYRGCMSVPLDIFIRRMDGIPRLCADISPEVLSAFGRKREFTEITDLELPLDGIFSESPDSGHAVLKAAPFTGTFHATVLCRGNFSLHLNNTDVVSENGRIRVNGTDYETADRLHGRAPLDDCHENRDGECGTGTAGDSRVTVFSDGINIQIHAACGSFFLQPASEQGDGILRYHSGCSSRLILYGSP